MRLELPILGTPGRRNVSSRGRACNGPAPRPDLASVWEDLAKISDMTPDATNLKSRLLVRFFVGLAVVACMLFIPAGSLAYWQGWVYIGIIFIPSVPASIFLYKRDPQLVQRRLQTKEKISEQRAIMKVAHVVFYGAFVLPGLDHRFGWSHLPPWATLVSQVLVLAGLLITFWVMAANSFASRIIEVAADQRVISTGPYRFVRHPMYFGAILVLLFTPLALGSYWALPGFALVIPIIAFRLLNEEKLLRRELPGYVEYCRHTRFRLLPFMW
jgi:protein-S-isoprenylcysteine O-methyltransferase Ste14